MPVLTISKKKKQFIKDLTELNIRKDIIKLFSDTDPLIFFDSLFEENYYSEKLIPIGYGQTGDDPHNLAKMLNYLNPDENDRILEIGTGSGFSTSLLSMLCREVYTIEYYEELALLAKNRLYSHGYENIRFYAGDASIESNTLSEKFDKIIIHSACKKRPLSLFSLVKKDGVVIYPMGPANQQQIIHLINTPDLDSGSNFKTRFLDIISCSHIIGPYGYEVEKLPPEFFEDSPDSFGVSQENKNNSK